MSSSSSTAAASAGATGTDAIFAYDEGHIAALESERPWTTQPKFFRHVKISAIASMKMLKHAMTGVEQGRRENGISFEVMGLIVGKPDGDTIIGALDMHIASVSRRVLAVLCSTPFLIPNSHPSICRQ